MLSSSSSADSSGRSAKVYCPCFPGKKLAASDYSLLSYDLK